MSDSYIPARPQPIVLRPLDKGIFTDRPTEMIPVGGFVDVKDFHVGPTGLRRRGDWVVDERFEGFSTAPPLRGLWDYWNADGVKSSFLVDNEDVYELGSSGGSFSATSIGATLNTLDTFSFEGRLLGGLSYPDYTMIDGKMVFVDSEHAIQVYDGTTLAELNAAMIYIPTCITTYRDRLFIGQIRNETGGFTRQRIRWSDVSPNYDTFSESAYVDLPYVQGALWRLIPFSNMLAALFSDAVFLGRPTNAPTMPVYFEQMETGGVGIVGMRAVTGWFDRLFFVGKNNVYELNAEGIRSIGDHSISARLEEKSAESLAPTMMYTDSIHEKIGVALAENGSNLTELWEMDLKSGAWTKLSVPSNMGFIREAAISFPIVIGDLSTTIGATPGTFGDYTTDIGQSRIYFGGGDEGRLGFLDKRENSTGVDYTGLAVQGSFETGDFDLDKPNLRKLWSRMSIKLRRQLRADDEAILLQVDGSVDRGQRWKRLGVLSVAPSTDEGKINFRLVGATARFRVRQISQNPPYEIVDIVLRAKPRGRESRYE